MNATKKHRIFWRALTTFCVLAIVIATASTIFWMGDSPAVADDGSEKPAIPASLVVVTQQGSLDVGLDWGEVEKVTHYLVRWRSVDKGEKLNAGVQEKSTSTTIKVGDYGSWVVRVQACNAAGCGKPVNKQFRVEPAPTPTPEPTAEPVENSPATGAPTITGTVQVGETLTVNPSGISDDDGLANATLSYQWLSDDADISGATSSTYTLAAADEGKAIKVRVSFTDNAGNDETLTSAATAAVASRPNSPATGAPTITGTVQVGETLTASTSGISDDDGLANATFSYQWLADDADISGATSSTYTLAAADEGKAVKVRVSFTDDAGNDEALTSAATAAVAPPALTASFQNVPSKHDGKRLFSFELRFSENFPGKMSYRKLQDEAFQVKNGSVRGASRLVKGTNRSWTISVRPDSLKNVIITLPATTDCTATGAVCTQAGRALSNATSVTVAGPAGNSPATGTPTITGTVQVGETLTAGTAGISDDDGLANATFSYQWLSDDADISGATSSTYSLTAAVESKAVKVRVSFTDDAGNEESLTSEPTAAVALPPKPARLESAATEVAGRGMILTFTKDIGLSGLHTDYTVLVDGTRRETRSAFWEGATVGLVLKEVVLWDETVTVAYARPASGALLFDTDEVPVESFGPVSVENTVPRPENVPATGAPTITGTAKVGETLTVDTSGIADADGLNDATFRYQWVADDADISGATSSTYTLAAADEGKAVKVRVSFIDDADNDEKLTSAATAAVVANYDNRRPQELSAAFGGPGKLVVSWQPPPYFTTPYIDAFAVQWKSAGQDFDTTRRAVVTSFEDPSYTITGLSDGTDYTVRVAAVSQTNLTGFTDDDGQDRTASIQVRFRTEPPGPQGLSATAGGAGELVVSWQAPPYSTTPEINAYLVQWKRFIYPYSASSQAIVTDLDNLSHTITGLNASRDYTVRVAAVNQSDVTEFTDDDGRERVATTLGVTAPQSASPLDLSLSGDGNKVIVRWKPVNGAVRYLIDRRSAEQFFGSGRIRERSSGSASYTFTIDDIGLDTDTVHAIKVAAVNDQNYEVTRALATNQRAPVFARIGKDLITPHAGAHKWLTEAWFTVTPNIAITETDGASYDPATQTISLSQADLQSQSVVHRALAAHYLMSPHVFENNPTGRLSIYALWLYMADPDNRLERTSSAGTSVADALAKYTAEGDAAVFPDSETRAVVAAAHSGSIPQWFYDTYTTDGTLDTADLDKLWEDLRRLERADAQFTHLSVGARGLFGGYCSLSEAGFAVQQDPELAFGNPWVDGGCVNHQFRHLSAAGTVTAGALKLSWLKPLWTGSPPANGYLVQWKSGNEEYDSTRQAVVTEINTLSHTITGLTAGVDYTIRVAAVVRSGLSQPGYQVATYSAEIVATAPPPTLNLSLLGIDGAVYTDWSPIAISAISPAKYVVQWRSGSQSYSSTRRHEVRANARTSAIDGLDTGTTYTVRLAALDDQDQELLFEEQSVQILTARQGIEDHIVNPLKEANPWMQEAWFDVPVGIEMKDRPCRETYWHTPRTAWIVMCRPFRANYWPFVHELAHHYTLSPLIHQDNPEARLGLISMWLHQQDRANWIPWLSGYNANESVAELLLLGTGIDHTQGRADVSKETVALAHSVSQGEIPQWFYDTYTTDGTLATTDLDRLLVDLKTPTSGTGLKHTRNLFGGHCSLDEARQARQKSSTLRNAWVDGGCVNRRPQSLAATAGGAGELTVTWQQPLWRIAPAINAYVVQWKSGNQAYDTTRQVVVTDLASLSTTITGLTTGTEYTVRVAAVNQADTTNFNDNDGRSRTAETTGTAE